MKRVLLILLGIFLVGFGLLMATTLELEPTPSRADHAVYGGIVVVVGSIVIGAGCLIGAAANLRRVEADTKKALSDIPYAKEEPES